MRAKRYTGRTKEISLQFLCGQANPIRFLRTNYGTGNNRTSPSALQPLISTKQKILETIF